MPKRRVTTPAQKAASRRNLEKARRAKKPRSQYTGKVSERAIRKKLVDPSLPIAPAGSRPVRKTKTRKDFASAKEWRDHLRNYKEDSSSASYDKRVRNDPATHKSLAKALNREAADNRHESRRLKRGLT